MMKNDLQKASIQQLSELYEEAATRYGQASEDADPRANNAQHRRISTIWKELKHRGEEGRDVALRLLTHANPHVRGWAAFHALEFAPERAIAELERLAREAPLWLKLDAEMTLKEFRAGRLSFKGIE